jgi:hypothetical protein
MECDNCGEMKPEKGAESVIVYVHRVEGRAVGVDREDVCADCLEEGKMMADEAAIDAHERAQDMYYFEK